MNYYIISFSVTALISFLIALFVLSRNTQSKLNITFSFYSLSVFFWPGPDVSPTILILLVEILTDPILRSTSFAHLLKASRTRVSFAETDCSPVTLNWPLLTSLILLSSEESFLSESFEPGFFPRITTEYCLAYFFCSLDRYLFAWSS